MISNTDRSDDPATSATAGGEPALPARSPRSSRRAGRLFLLMFVVGGVGYVAWQVREASARAAAIAEIQKRGGSIGYDFQGRTVSEPDGPQWARTLLGDHYFVIPIVVLMNNREVDDGDVAAVLDELKSLPSVQSIDLQQSRITDESLRKLAALVWLRRISVIDTKVTPQGIAALESQLPKVQISRHRPR